MYDTFSLFSFYYLVAGPITQRFLKCKRDKTSKWSRILLNFFYTNFVPKTNVSFISGNIVEERERYFKQGSA